MEKYVYIGPDERLIGHSAYGIDREGVFTVQVDDLTHEWADGWHESPKSEWEVLECTLGQV